MQNDDGVQMYSGVVSQSSKWDFVRGQESQLEYFKPNHVSGPLSINIAQEGYHLPVLVDGLDGTLTGLDVSKSGWRPQTAYRSIWRAFAIHQAAINKYVVDDAAAIHEQTGPKSFFRLYPDRHQDRLGNAHGRKHQPQCLTHPVRGLIRSL